MQTLNDLGTHSQDVAASLPKTFTIVPSAEEVSFYDQYPWVLNAFPTMREVMDYLAEELRKLQALQNGWQQREVVTNVFLLSCSVTDTIDDFVAGNTYDLSKLSRAFPLAGLAVGILNQLMAGARRFREIRLSHLRAWATAWRSAVTDFLQQTMVGELERSVIIQQCEKLAGLLPRRLPKRLWVTRPKMPAFFRSRDFSSFDCLELGRKYVERFPNADRPVMVLGLRTAGSFLGPLLCAYLRTRLPSVDSVAIRPKKGLSLSERVVLRQASLRRSRVLVIDESIHSGHTLVNAITLLRRMGFKDDDIVVLNPAEPAFPDWKDSRVVRSVPNVHFITLEPAERYKQHLLDSGSANSLLKEYFRAIGYRGTSIKTSGETERLNAQWRNRPPERVDVRLKRLFDVHLTDAEGRSVIRRVLAKSVGWGWPGYHAFHAGRALKEFVPPILGLRDGILYTEWLSQEPSTAAAAPDRRIVLAALSSYAAARSSRLEFNSSPTPFLVRESRHKGMEMLAGTLSRAYGSRITAAVQRSRIQEKLAQCGLSVLTDSKMGPDEWVSIGSSVLKTDFEHHGQGKNELGMTDPAYDLADAIFQFGLSEVEERALIDTYVTEGSDITVEERLFLNKLLAGLWAQNLATLGLHSSRLVSRRDEFHKQSVAAWNFLVSQTVRECGKLCKTVDTSKWGSPLVVLDIDGVLDRMVFGFPSTTAAGIKAVELLACHGFTVALNTARSLNEVKEYCRAYGFPGGVAEYGAVAWDRATNRQVSLVTPDSMLELDEARAALRNIPGVFLNEDYEYSLRAFTYENGRTTPLPRLMVHHLLTELKLDRLQAHHTGLDTAITARDTDKGRGLRAMLSLVELADVDVTAVGDSEPDLAMFHVANRSFAPGNVSCRKEAELLGCRVAKSSYQPGLLEIARKIIHPEGSSCQHCRHVESRWRDDTRLFVSLLKAADKNPLSLLLRNCLDPVLWRVFRT